MLRYVIRRVAIIIPTLLLLSVVIFWATRKIASPEKALTFNPRIRAEDKQRYAEQLGLDDSAPEQYWRWLSNLLRGDLGDSLISNKGVWEQLESALANTLVLAVSAFVFSLFIGVIIGVISAVRQNGFFDYITNFGSVLGLSIPTFLFALLAQIFFAVWLTDWLDLSSPFLPTAGMFKPGSQGFDLWDRARHIALPALVLSVQLIAVYSKYIRASMIEVLGSDYVRTARAKGLSESRVLTRHGLRTGMVPITTQASIDLAALVGGLVVTEQIFQWPGMGTLFLNALEDGDYVIILPWLLITAAAVMIMSVIADVLYAILDPRIRYD